VRALSGAKARWSLGISVLVWSVLFFVGVSIFGVRREGMNLFYFGPLVIPFFLLIAVAGALATWPALIGALSIGEALLQVLGRAAPSLDRWSRRQKFAATAVLLFLIGAAAIPTIASSAARFAQPTDGRLSQPSKAEQLEAEALRVAGGHPPSRCEGASMPPPDPTGPTRQVVGAAPVWLQFASVGTITARGDDLVLTDLGTVLLRPRTMQGNLADKVVLFWAVSDNYRERVVVRIIDTSTGDPVWALGNMLEVVRAGTLSNGYRIYVVSFYIEHAGCYIVEAAWPGGSWRAPLAAGQ
jgi:hypothetical protein